MSRNKSTLLWVTALAIAVFVIIFLAADRHHLAVQEGLTRRALQRSNKAIQLSRDTIAELKQLQANHTHAWQEYTSLQRDSLRAERAAKIKWRNEYVKAQNMHTHLPDDISRSELDSLVAAFIRQHRPDY